MNNPRATNRNSKCRQEMTARCGLSQIWARSALFLRVSCAKWTYGTIRQQVQRIEESKVLIFSKSRQRSARFPRVFCAGWTYGTIQQH
jgi:hypothetical protein